MCGRLEVHVQILRQVPAYGEVPIPQELLAEGQRQVGVLGVLQVALLQLVVVAQYLGVERDVLRQVVESQGFGEIEPLRLTLHLLEGLPCLVDRRIGVVEGASPLILVLIDGSLARGVAVRVAVADREVGRVVGHGVLLVLDAYSRIGQREVARDVLRDGYRLYGVALTLIGCRLQGIVQFHVRVERVVLRADGLLRVRIIKRCADLGLFREELAQFQIGRYRVA